MATVRRSTAKLALVLLLALIATAPRPAEALDKVVLGTVNSITHLPVDIAVARGYFRERGIDLEVKFFSSGVDIVPAVGTGELDIGEGSVTPGVINAIGRGLKIQSTALKASCAVDYDFCPIVVRKDLYDSGGLKNWAQIRGRKIGISNRYTVSHDKLVLLDKAFGVNPAGYEIVTIPFSQMTAALANKALDAAVIIEPIATRAEQQGIGVRLLDGKHSPHVMVTLTSFSEKFVKRPEVGRRFMVAFMKGARDLVRARRAVANGDRAPWNAIRALALPTKSINELLKDDAVGNKVSPAYVDPNLRVDEQELERVLAWYQSAGKLEGRPVAVREFVDHSFVEYALKELGPFKE